MNVTVFLAGGAGVVLLVATPAAATAMQPPSPTPRWTSVATQSTYTVQPGDTLYSIAQRFGTTVQALVGANDIANPNVIAVGRVLTIPGGGGGSDGGDDVAGVTIYVVQAGDTLAEVASRFNTTVSALVQKNHIADPNVIRVGQELVIPIPDGDGATAGLLTVVNERYSAGLSPGFAPADLVPVPAEWEAPGHEGQRLRLEARDALVDMLQAARADGLEIRIRSSFRSYETQERLFQFWVEQLGRARAEQVSAHAGHSEHQLGTTADLTSASVGFELTEAFADTPEGRWLRNHAHEFGFALSYPPGSEPVTGFDHEPWHYRYIGPEHAEAWADSGLVLVEYLRELGQ